MPSAIAGIGISPNMKSLSCLASEHRALVAINGSYYNMSEGNSVCFLKVEDTVADSTESREFRIRVNGAIAITKKKQVLFITVDGRAPQHAVGMSLPELAQLIKQLGGVTAINLDGGGSTMLYLDGHILNHPTDNGRFDHEGERKIPNMIYFR